MRGRRFSCLHLLVVVVALTVCMDAHAQRTIRNETAAPFVYVFTNRHALDSGDGLPVTELVDLLNARRASLVELAPRGMWSIPEHPGVVVGYFAGGPSAFAFSLVQVAIDTGTDTVAVGPDSVVQRDGRPVVLAPWEIPARDEPISLDGNQVDWEDTPVIARVAAYEPPDRITLPTAGELIEPGESRYWRQAGTGVRLLRSQLGTDWWFISIEADGPIQDGTGYHLRTLASGTTATADGEFVVLTSGNSGPSVLRAPDGRVELAGQYVRNGSFIEFSVSRELLAEFVPDPYNEQILFELATSRRVGERVERFTITTIEGRELLAP